ncbi:N-acetylmuramoyl-L-alanine amidase [Streptomyces sp. NPDC057757]|uniref:N-acetylmuramoyl-L-alanine amidase n=1 Tax=Streptomyces sp. NPDC057757 TaxID=3346241 RepID=UPI0036B2F90A
MASPMSAAQFAAGLRAEGVTVKGRSGWSTHNRNSKGAWGPLNGVMIHHTVSGDGDGIVNVCWSGRPDLPGPLCHGVIHKNGTVTLVGWGRANHAGAGDPDALAAVVDESAVHPAPNERTVDGNARFVGFECVNLGDGRDPWPEAQLDAIARASAAVCRYYGWGADSVIGHLEWTNQKIDPRGFAMRSMRDRIAERLEHTAGWKPGTATPKPTPPKETDVALTAAEMNDLADLVADKVWARQVKVLDTDTTWTTAAQLRAPHTLLREVKGEIGALTELVTQLLTQKES